jgi:hypothetical protein
MKRQRRRRVGANAAWRRSDYRFAVVSLALLIFLLGTSVGGWLSGNQYMVIASPPVAAPQATSRL